MKFLTYLLLVFIVANLFDKEAGIQEYVIAIVFIGCMRLLTGSTFFPKTS